MGSFLSNIPIVSDIYDAVRGNPDEIKAAYDAQIAASQKQSKEMRDFLMGQKGQAQAFYAPMQHMFSSMYGTEGIRPQLGSQTMGMGVGGPFGAMYGGGSAPSAPMAQQMPSPGTRPAYPKGAR